MSSLNFSITNRTNGTPPSKGVPFVDIKNEVLGTDYELSLVFIDDELSQQLNSQHRDKDYPTNILSFPLEDESGEIFINLDAVSREHDEYKKSEKEFIGYLFIHGVHHLKGMAHGSTMERAEADIQQKFGLE